MELYLIRHADAEPRENYPDDEDEKRPLTEAGRKQAACLADGLQRRGIALSRVVTSPLVRARQTAEEMLRHWQTPAPELLECDELAPDGRPKKLTRYLLGLDGDAIALVGHMPDLGDYVGWLIDGKGAQIDLAKAGVACVSFSVAPGKGSGKLRWIITPEWLG